MTVIERLTGSVTFTHRGFECALEYVYRRWQPIIVAPRAIRAHLSLIAIDFTCHGDEDAAIKAVCDRIDAALAAVVKYASEN